MRQVFSSLQVWGREYTCYQQWFSQSRVGDQTRTEHREPLKGKAMCGVGKKRREAEEKLPFSPPNHIFTLF